MAINTQTPQQKPTSMVKYNGYGQWQLSGKIDKEALKELNESHHDIINIGDIEITNAQLTEDGAKALVEILDKSMSDHIKITFGRGCSVSPDALSVLSAAWVGPQSKVTRLELNDALLDEPTYKTLHRSMRQPGNRLEEYKVYITSSYQHETGRILDLCETLKNPDCRLKILALDDEWHHHNATVERALADAIASEHCPLENFSYDPGRAVDKGMVNMFMKALAANPRLRSFSIDPPIVGGQEAFDTGRSPKIIADTLLKNPRLVHLRIPLDESPSNAPDLQIIADALEHGQHPNLITFNPPETYSRYKQSTLGAPINNICVANMRRVHDLTKAILDGKGKAHADEIALRANALRDYAEGEAENYHKVGKSAITEAVDKFLANNTATAQQPPTTQHGYNDLAGYYARAEKRKTTERLSRAGLIDR